jgi:hypothetical protein
MDAVTVSGRGEKRAGPARRRHGRHDAVIAGCGIMIMGGF